MRRHIDERLVFPPPAELKPAPAPPDERAWSDGIAACVRSRERLHQIARDVQDLTATVPTGTGTQTYLRGLLLAADHAAYHVGQIVAVRKALRVWR